jgi:hypothetical protein
LRPLQGLRLLVARTGHKAPVADALLLAVRDGPRGQADAFLMRQSAQPARAGARLLVRLRARWCAQASGVLMGQRGPGADGVLCFGPGLCTRHGQRRAVLPARGVVHGVRLGLLVR